MDSIKISKEHNMPTFPNTELEILRYWEEKDILRKSIEQRPTDKPFTFYDGPITSNNKPHYGHALTMVIKDVVPRYKTMKGFRVDRSLGWDCQGIPVEYEVEKELGFEQKEDIEKFGIEKFNEMCRKSVEKYQGEISALTKRMGRWVNKDEEYATMDSSYIESVWWSLKELYNKGLLYQGYKVVPYSTRAGTTLSNSEVALGGYQAVVDPAVTVKLKLKEKDSYLLIWTTTPWTLPGNLLAAVGRSFDYVEVEYEGEKYIVGKELVETIFGKQLEILNTYKGEELVGMEYEPLYPYYAEKSKEGAFKVVHAEHVTFEDGTGIVHQAPYGEEDFILMTGMGIGMFDYLDDQGNMKEEIEQFKGMFYKKANKYIMQDLQERNLLFKHEEYEHQMPMCWRTNTPLIYKPIKSWYVKVTAIRELLVKENKSIGWVPEHVKEGRFGNWLEDARDWALSRNRYWGTPLPAWVCDKCGEVEVLGSFAEVKEKSGVELRDPHKPFVDDITYKCEKCAGEMRRVEDVIDVWYDSGAMPFARFHYPFENQEKFKSKYPAEFIGEGVDQTRGWFYTLHVLGGALFNKKAFKNVIVNGMALAPDGTKMSKSKRNYTEVNLVLDQLGADALRLYFVSSPIVNGEEVVFSEKFLKDITATVLLPYWNSVKYFLNYQSQFKWKYDSNWSTDNVMDRWILARLNQTVQEVEEGMESYKLHKASKPIFNLIDDLSKWYIRRSRERFVNGDKQALDTLHFVLFEISKLMAPFAPFISESVYMTLANGFIPSVKESVHLEDFPSVNKEFLNEELLSNMSKVRDICSIGLNIRDEKKLKVRQPLSKVYIPLEEKDMMEIVKGELNVKDVIYSEKKVEGEGIESQEAKYVFVSLDTKITEELKEEGLLNEIVRGLQVARKDSGCQMGEMISVKYRSESKEILDLIEKNKEKLCKMIFVESFEKSQEITGNTVIKVENYTLEIEIVK
ncbi:isoleucine--tRNA ligase [Candidatus Dojkabacteria bacterium HGW-Dojkabacteria-1]|uniref:Isoleucine--tRNA ligase n=1 Tax=Candidatus Dojkabacteria bacterium HGW-Dojkabacteria-1 TaxID=2013761 RepID=A0A2N2F3G9_9BACT|nr:MAG: isoleucine--tRNA ligase [Candidatus Dojkabacteria bacterium HGW-Dojkabacteria-1]